ncbi:DUF58 domain-containing protein [Butyrivibrio sp. YAB3001]|uniref:DUF58 domain-containing protein n=1 Tax=Butyrivibrio sp. YAB3001 TaxID=1520812 RepID=UPI001FA84928|nr:DUF58 domain-containing protein [Butyrivibrio sp. YAB3001]
MHRLTKGEDHRYRALIENAGILPIHRMKLWLYKDRCSLYEIDDGREVSLSIHEKKELLSGINCIYAGAYEVGIEKVSFEDPFHIFEVILLVPYSFRAIVSPRIIDVADRVLDLENLFNNSGLKSDRLFENIPGSNIRAYQRGDSLSSINWKVSARLSELMVRVPDRMENRTVTVLMDAVNVPECEQDSAFLKKRDYFLEFVISAAWHFAKQSVPVKMVYPSGKVRESVVDSYNSFLEFYSIVADSIFYSTKEDEKEIHDLVDSRRIGQHDGDTWIIIREDPGKGEEHFIIC